MEEWAQATLRWLAKINSWPWVCHCSSYWRLQGQRTDADGKGVGMSKPAIGWIGEKPENLGTQPKVTSDSATTPCLYSKISMETQCHVRCKGCEMTRSYQYYVTVKKIHHTRHEELFVYFILQCALLVAEMSPEDYKSPVVCFPGSLNVFHVPPPWIHPHRSSAHPAIRQSPIQ